MKGGLQILYMNGDCFGNGLITPVQKLLYTVAFTRNHLEPSPTEPLSLNDQVELSSMYDCKEQIEQMEQTLLRYNHQNMRQMEDETVKLKDVVNRLSARVDGNEKKTKTLSNTVKRLSKRGAKCGYKEHWVSADSTITYDRILTSTGTGRGTLHKGTGIWEATQTGLYLVTWSMHTDLNKDDSNTIFLYRNDEKIDESEHFSKYWDNDDTEGYEGTVQDQGGRTMLMQLDHTDSLHLETEEFGSDGADEIIFCIHLLSAAA